MWIGRRKRDVVAGGGRWCVVWSPSFRCTTWQSRRLRIGGCRAFFPIAIGSAQVVCIGGGRYTYVGTCRFLDWALSVLPMIDPSLIFGSGTRQRLTGGCLLSTITVSILVVNEVDRSPWTTCRSASAVDRLRRAHMVALQDKMGLTLDARC